MRTKRIIGHILVCLLCAGMGIIGWQLDIHQVGMNVFGLLMFFVIMATFIGSFLILSWAYDVYLDLP